MAKTVKQYLEDNETRRAIKERWTKADMLPALKEWEMAEEEALVNERIVTMAKNILLNEAN